MPRRRVTVESDIRGGIRQFGVRSGAGRSCEPRPGVDARAIHPRHARSAVSMPSSRSGRFVGLAVFLAGRAAAQCELAFGPGDPVACPAGSVAAAQVFDPDGSGPSADMLVVGGLFSVARSHDVAVAAYDGSEWRSLAAPVTGSCTALGSFGGRLIVAVSRSSTSSAILAFDGTTWQTIGALRGVAQAMTVFDRTLVLGGVFSHVDGLPASNVAAWDGTAWSALGVGAGGVSGRVRALAVFTEGLYVGGDITSAGGVPVGNLAVWNGTAWAASAACNSSVRALAVFAGTSVSNSFLFVGGNFNTVGPLAARGVARFNSLTGWSAMGSGIPSGCSSLFLRATGSFTFDLNAGSGGTASVVRWSGSAWNPVGTGPFAYFGESVALTRFRGQPVALPAFRLHGNVRALDAAGAWLPLAGTGIDGPITAVHATATDLVIAGAFTSISGVRMNGIARGGPGAWLPLGTGIDDGGVNAIAHLPNGDIVVAGILGSVGGVAVRNIARWDGVVWSPLGAGLDGGSVQDLAVMPDGQLIAAGGFTAAGNLSVGGIARWDGVNWSPLASGLLGGPAMALTVAANGELIAGGSFQTAGGIAAANLARFDGSVWSAFPGQPNGSVTALATLTNGDVLVGGHFSAVGAMPTNHVARWRGVSSAWFAVPGLTFVPFGRSNAIIPLGGSDAILANDMLGAGPTLVRFDGQALGVGALPSVLFTCAVRARDGAVMFGGGPTSVGVVATGLLAQLASPCPALAPAFGSGCAGSGGSNSMRWTSLPWLGSTFRAQTDGLSSIGLALGVTGLTATSIPIVSFLPQGLPGCNLLATPDLIELVTPRLGRADTALALPELPALIGQVLHHQVVALELDGAANLVAATSSNGLRLTIGRY